MRKTFAKWLLLFISIAFLVTFSAAYYLQTEQATANSVRMIELRIQDAKKQIRQNTIDLAVISVENDALARNKASKLAEMLELDKSMLTDIKQLELVKILIAIDEINIVDGSGIIVASTMPSYLGFNMSSGTQSREFNDELLTGKNVSFVQEMGAITYNSSKVMQYAGNIRYGEKGYVQVGYIPERLISAKKIADISNLAPTLRVGSSGKIIICQKDKIVSIDNQALLGKNIREYGINLSNSRAGELINLKINNIDSIALYDTFDKYTILGLIPTDEMFLSRNNSIKELIVFNLLIFIVVFFLVRYLIQKVIITGIEDVNKSLNKITAGNLDEVVGVRTNQEFISLSDGINSTVQALKNAIAEAKARIDKELELAKTIQLSALPSILATNRWDKFEVQASMRAAKEVGGDFYDFFAIDKQRVAFIIADVSGKGIAAAMFMMKAKALLKNQLQSGVSVQEAFCAANNELCENNDAFMFVTVFGGILDTISLEFTYVNAGHNPPLIRRAGEYQYLRPKKNIVMGNFEDYKFKQETIHLHTNDILFLYTDGVTEAFNMKQELYSDGRLLKFLNSIAAIDSCQTIDTRVIASIDAFAGGAEQSDDITLLTIKIN